MASCDAWLYSPVTKAIAKATPSHTPSRADVRGPLSPLVKVSGFGILASMRAATIGAVFIPVRPGPAPPATRAAGRVPVPGRLPGPGPDVVFPQVHGLGSPAAPASAW